MINVSRAINDPRFSQLFKVFRKSGEWEKGRFIEKEKTITINGVITPSKPKEIEMIPEGDRVGGEVTIHTTNKLYTTHLLEGDSSEEGTSDIIEWQDERYKLYQVNNYSQYGYYSAIGMRLVSN